MVTCFYMVRHTQPNYSNPDNAQRELTAKGLADRHLVTGFLADKNIGAVLSSPYKRAVDTLLPFAEAQGLQIECIDGFCERRVDSVWIDDFETFSRRQWADFSYKLTDGESLAEVQQRNVAALDAARARHRGKNVAVGCHGTALSTLINHYDPTFGYERFDEMRGLMPWVVKMVFEDDCCFEIEEIDLFAAQA